METARRISKNAAYLGAAEIISRILQFAVMIAAARSLSVDNFGMLNFALSLAFIAMILADWGVNQLLVRTIARDKGLAEKYIANAISIKAALSALTGVGMALLLLFLDYPQDAKMVVLIIWAFAILGTFTELLYSLFRSFERMEYDSILKIIRMVLLASIAISILWRGGGVVAVSFAFVISEAIVVAIGAFIAKSVFLKKKIEFSLVDFHYMLSMLKEAFPFGLAIVFGSIYFFISTVMLQIMKGDFEVALFSSAYNIALALLFIPTVYTNAIFPVLSRYFIQSKEKAALLYERSFKYLYIAGLPLSILLSLLSEEAVVFLYGQEYAAASIILKVISWYLVLKFLNFHLGITLSAIDDQRKRMVGQGITAAINILLNLLLIPLYGSLGAAVSTFVTEIALFGIYFFFASQKMPLKLTFFEIAKPLLASAAMAGVLFFLTAHVIAEAIVGIAVYGAVVLLLNTFDKTDYRILRGILESRDTDKK